MLIIIAMLPSEAAVPSCQSQHVYPFLLLMLQLQHLGQLLGQAQGRRAFALGLESWPH